MKSMIFGMFATLAGGAYFGGWIGGHDIERTVQATPAATYEGFRLILNDYEGLYDYTSHSSTDADSKRELGIRIKVKVVPNKSIDYTLTQKDKPFLNMVVNFTPADDGKATKVALDYDLQPLAGKDGKVEEGLPIGSKARFTLALKLIMNGLIRGIESGKTAEIKRNLADARWRMSMNRSIFAQGSGYSRHAQREVQEQASAAMLDPNEVKAKVGGTAVSGTAVSGTTINGGSKYGSSGYRSSGSGNTYPRTVRGNWPNPSSYPSRTY